MKKFILKTMGVIAVSSIAVFGLQGAAQASEPVVAASTAEVVGVAQVTQPYPAIATAAGAQQKIPAALAPSTVVKSGFISWHTAKCALAIGKFVLINGSALRGVKILKDVRWVIKTMRQLGVKGSIRWIGSFAAHLTGVDDVVMACI